jgi:hypothetical protein
MKLGEIEFYVHVSEFVSESRCYVYERYLDSFTILSRKELSVDEVAAVISLYLKEAKTRPEYKNFKEELIDKHISFSWSDLDDEKRFKTNFRDYFPELYARRFGY